jgi:hypothetical protein
VVAVFGNDVDPAVAEAGDAQPHLGGSRGF